MANKMDLVEKVAATIGCTKADGERAVEAIIDMITNTLKSGDEVSIAGLGIFQVAIETTERFADKLVIFVITRLRNSVHTVEK